MTPFIQDPRVVTLEPKGYRDVYWCWIINEPGVLNYKDDHAQCSVCDWVSDEAGPDDAFLREHKFVCHILKPRAGQATTISSGPLTDSIAVRADTEQQTR